MVGISPLEQVQMTASGMLTSLFPAMIQLLYPNIRELDDGERTKAYGVTIKDCMIITQNLLHVVGGIKLEENENEDGGS